MAISYQSGFNSGELSDKLKGRSDLDVYRNGCSRLENFLVLPQGGVERRPGTAYLGKTADITFDAWSNAVEYEAGDKVYDSVSDANYICDVAHDPSYAPAWDAANSYDAGDFVTDGGSKYVCATDHIAATLWTVGEDYAVNDIVIDSGTVYVCDVEQNAPFWVAFDAYVVGDIVENPIGSYYVCKLDHSGSAIIPSADATNWEAYTTINQRLTRFVAYTTINQSGTNYDLSSYFNVYNTFADASSLYWSVHAIPTAGSEKCRLIPFVFSSSDNYAVELGNGYAKVWNPDGTYTNVSGEVPYSADDVALIDYYQRFDILYLTHPSHPIKELRRTSISPEFVIASTEFDYPPTLDENQDGTTLQANPKYDVYDDSTPQSFPKGTIISYGESDYISKQITTGSGTFISEVNDGEWRVYNESSVWTITADAAIFDSDDWIGAHLVLRHDRSLDQGNSNINWEGVLTTGEDYTVAAGTSYNFTASWASSKSSARNRDEADYAGLFIGGVGVEYGQNWSYTGTSSAEIIILAGDSNNGRAKLVTAALSGVASSFTGSEVSEALNVSYSNWTVTTGDTWTGRLVIERKTDGKEWREYLVLGDTTGGIENNFTYSSPLPEGKNTYIRLRSIIAGGNCTYSIQGDSGVFTGVGKIVARTSTTEVDVTEVSAFEKTSPTFNWSMGAFNDVNGYPRSISFHEDRMWLVGSNLEPATIYGSTLGDYYNFLPGAVDDSAIRRIPTSAEQAEWLIGKRYLFAGTEGGTLLISSSNRDDVITPANIKTEYQSVFGASNVSPVLANDVVIYPQKNGLKLREMIYNYEEENFRSNDLNILSDSILSSGVIDMFIQKQPDQVVWCIKSDGTAALLTYERGQEVVGWSRFETDGDVISGCATPASGSDDQVWLVVKRGNATDGYTYCVELCNSRSEMSNYIDSAVDTGGETAEDCSISVDEVTGDIKVTDNAHGFSGGELLTFSGTTLISTTETYTVDATGLDPNFFYILTAGGDRVIYTDVDTITVAGSISGLADGDYIKSNNIGIAVSAEFYQASKDNYVYRLSSDKNWGIGPKSASQEYNHPDTGSDIPPKSGWFLLGGGTPAAVTISYTLPTDSGTYRITRNSISGLDHLEGEAVQVLGDGAYIGEHTVASGAITFENYYNSIIAGLGYSSIMRTMPVEPILGNRMSQSRVKGISNVIVKFYNTIGGRAGEKGKALTILPANRTYDEANEQIDSFTGDIDFNIANDWTREKILEVRQDNPYQMTILSLSAWTEVAGG